jgi:hypothetical protein
MKHLWLVSFILVPLATWALLKLASGYFDGTTGKEIRERGAHDRKCGELRAEFFKECQSTLTRQQCEALYGQTGGRLFDGPPQMPFSEQLDCGTARSPWDGR